MKPERVSRAPSAARARAVRPNSQAAPPDRARTGAGGLRAAVFGRLITPLRPPARGRRPQRIGLFGMFGCGNTGNDGSLEAMLMFLRRVVPGAEVACICIDPERVGGTYAIEAFPIGQGPPRHPALRSVDALLAGGLHKLGSLALAFRHARTFDLILIPGTGILDDFGDTPAGVPTALVAWCLAARLCGTKIAFVSIGAGPIHHPLSRWLMKRAAAMARYRSYRDSVSKAFMESIGFDTRDDAVFPDIAFGLPAPPAGASASGPDGPLTIGIGVMTYFGWRNDRAQGATIYARYLEILTRFALWLLDRGHPIRVLMGDASDERAVQDLVVNLRRARPDLPAERVCAQPVASLHELMRQIAKTDLIVATRYHNVVCALKLGRPTISIGYAEKNDALMGEMGLGRFCQHVERLDLDVLTEQISRLMEERTTFESRLDEANQRLQERLGQQEAILASGLLGCDLEPTSRSRASEGSVEVGRPSLEEA